MGYTFLDIGDVVELKCVKQATKSWLGLDVVAIGKRGELRFNLFPQAYSRGLPQSKLPDGSLVHLFDIRITAFLRLLQELRNNLYAERFCTSFKKGDTIDLPTINFAWEILKNHPLGMLNRANDDNLWVNVEGVAVPEPEDFRKVCAVTEMYQVAHEIAQGINSGFSCDYEVMIDLAGRILKRPISDNDFNFMMEWYCVTADVARTINLHIRRWGDFKPNANKVERFFSFCNQNIERMEKLCRKWVYARHLWQCKQQIEASRTNDWKSFVEHVEVYQRGRFGYM